MPCQNITPATVLPNFDGLPCQSTERFMFHLPRPADRWLSQTREWMRRTTLRNTLADLFSSYLFTYTTPRSCNVSLWHRISLFTSKSCHCSMIAPCQAPSIENFVGHDKFDEKCYRTCFLVLRWRSAIGGRLCVTANECKAMTVLSYLQFLTFTASWSFLQRWICKLKTLELSALSFVLADSCTLPASVSLTKSTAAFGSISTLGVFDKSPDKRAETAGLGVFPRERALRWRLWNWVGNRWCTDAHSHASYRICWEDVALLSASNLGLTQWCSANAGETGLPDDGNRSSRLFWDPAAIIASFKASDLPTGVVLMVLLASPRWPSIGSESLDRLPPVVWWGNAGVFINQAMVGVHKFELSIFCFWNIHVLTGNFKSTI